MQAFDRGCKLQGANYDAYHGSTRRQPQFQELGSRNRTVLVAL